MASDAELCPDRDDRYPPRVRSRVCENLLGRRICSQRFCAEIGQSAVDVGDAHPMVTLRKTGAPQIRRLPLARRHPRYRKPIQTTRQACCAKLVAAFKEGKPNRFIVVIPIKASVRRHLMASCNTLLIISLQTESSIFPATLLSR